MIDFGLIRVDHSLQISYSPVLVCYCPIQSLPPIFFAVKRSFSLLNRPHFCIPQNLTNSACRERLVDDIGKWFGELGSIFSLPSIDKMLSMVYISRRKFSGMSS